MRATRLATICVLGTITLLAAIGEIARAAGPDEAAVRKADAGFYRALNAMFGGDLAPMKQVWSHADDVTYMGPTGGFQVGWKQVLPVWEEQAAMRLGGEISPQDVRVVGGSDLAVVHCREVGQNEVDGKPRKVSIRATNVYRKENGSWKMIGHHTDLLPFLED